MSTQLFSNNAILEILDPDSLTLHPVVFMFPELNPTDFDALVNSIRAHGQIDPVWITKDNQIVDGRHRWRAQKKLGQQVQCRRLKNFAPELLTSVIDHCIAQNINRRHMNKGQRAVVAAALEKKRRDAVRAQERGQLSLDGGTDFPWANFEEMLSVFKINNGMFYRGHRLLKHGQPKLVEAVANGTVLIHEAMHGVVIKDPYTEREVDSCLSSPKPGLALISLRREKSEKKKKKGAKQNIARPSKAITALSDLCFRCWYGAEDLDLIETTDFSGVWQEDPNKVTKIISDLHNGILARQKLISRLESVRPPE